MVYFDVTTTLAWNSKAIGIVRTEMELAKCLHWHDDIRFCKFDRSSGCYLTVEWNQVEQRIHSIGMKANMEPKWTKAPLANEIFYRVKGRLRSITFALPILRLGKAILGGLYARGRKLWRLVSESAKCNFGQSDVYVSVGHDWIDKDLNVLLESKKRMKFRTMLCCYDIIPMLFPENTSGDLSSFFGKYLVDMAWTADVVFCISKQTESDLRRYLASLGAPVPRIELLTLGADAKHPDGEEAIPDLVGRAFILYVSSFNYRKNHSVLYSAYLKLFSEGKLSKSPLVVLVGEIQSSNTSFLANIKQDGRIRDKFVILTDVSDSQLSWLYSNCQFTLYPSFYEGWGLPVVESLAKGKFCLASNAASIPEAGGEFAAYLDPQDDRAWAAEIYHFHNDDEALAEKVRAIQEGYHMQTWEMTGAIVRNCAADLITSGARLK